MDQPLTASIFDGLSRARVSAEYTERSPKKPSGAPETPDASLAVPPSFSRVTEPLSQDGQFPASPAAFPLGDPDRRLMSSKATSSHLLDQARKDEELIREVNAAASYSAEDDAKTLSYYDLATTEESPVVGWLVCVSGVYQGQSFRLKSGQNNVGRQQSMDVALARENSISRRRHALIIYDPASSDFYVQHGEGSGLTYLNGELVMTPKRLSSYDKLRLGAVEFVFMAFCGEKFTWDGDVKEDGLPSTTSNDDKSGGGGRS
ncbi:MAG: FHA domain-containing protein [Clostridiales bacterium]|jgi:hypothetical protein|nr:FHA domain-containing protein [Clostridiales bacterium]